jgi:hypothetical protein
MIESITARAEAQTLRFSLVYALLDQVDTIGLAHLKAGIAVWDYADDPHATSSATGPVTASPTQPSRPAHRRTR